MKSKKASQKDYSEIIKVWEESVIATHDFLSEEDRLSIKKEIPKYLSMVDVQLWYDEDELIGFSGIHQRNLEMLFLRPQEIGKGFGKQIISQLINEFKIQTLDVNEDNYNAVSFYKKVGFKVISRSELDDQNRPYSTLHMSL